MRYFFIDLENVQSAGLEGVHSLTSDDTVFIFYSVNAHNLSIPTLEDITSSKATVKYIKTNYVGANAMDFQIVSLLGAMIERTKAGSFYIITHDNGFKSAISFCESYFDEYDIRLGKFDNIIKALTEENKQKDPVGQEGQTTKKRSRHRSRSGKGNSSKDYIYKCLGELLSEKTIDIYADKIHEGIGASKTREDLHRFFFETYGEDEGEALFRVTQSSFDTMKAARDRVRK